MPALANASQDRQFASKPWHPDKDEQDDLDAIDAAISRLRNVTAPDPYVLTIPQDVEPRYRHLHRAWAEQWLSNTPFDRYEHESLQYQTFFFHEHGKDMYVLQTSRAPADEPANESAKTRPATGANTPNAGPKKKISLDAYKKKQTGATGTPERDGLKASDASAKQAAVKGPVERVKAESEEMLATLAESEGDLAPVNEQKTRSEKTDLKRKREEPLPKKERVDDSKIGSTTDTWDAAATAPAHDKGPPTKKAKMVLNQPAKSEMPDKSRPLKEKTSKSTNKRTDEETGMPPRLSPGMPPRLSPGLPEKLSPLRNAETPRSAKQTEPAESDEMYALPSRLSPTIPENIVKTLEARANWQSTPQPSDPVSAPSSVAKNKDEKLTPVKNVESVLKRKSPVPRNAFRASSGSPAVRSDVEERPRPVQSVAKPKSPVLSQDDEIAVGRAVHAKQAQKHGKDSLMVKIKYKKARREAIQRILKLPPKPAKIANPQPSTTQDVEESKPATKPVDKRTGERKESGPVKGVAQKIGPTKKEKKLKPPQENTQSSAEKRPAPSDDRFESPTKYKKLDESENRKEPSTPARREVDSPLAPKSAQQATPGARKDLLSVAMRREQSQDSVATHNTPPELTNTPTVNNPSSQTNGAARPPSSQPSSITPKQQAWGSEQKRLEALGRELKHAASAHVTASQQESSNTLAEQRLAAAKCVESFLCYLVAFTCADEASLSAEPKQAPAFKTWRSLNGFFGFVKRTTDPFGPLHGLACALGMVFSSRILEIATQYPGDGPSREGILETQAHLHKAAVDADARLDVDALQHAFPKSWGQRARKPLAADRLESNRLGGPFKLPIGVATTPIRAARAGHAILQEWMEQEKVEYQLKLQL